MKKRKVYPGEVHHVCQMTEGKVLIFYSPTDYLVFFTVFCTVAKRMGITVLALCPMPDHIHQVTKVEEAKQLSFFVGEYSRLFAWLWNTSRKIKGDLFHHNFKSSAKLGNKQVRTTLAYNNNNAVERKLVEKAEEYRWNFLAYARNTHPFSAPFSIAEASRALRRAVQEASACYKQGKYLNHAQVDRWMRKLSFAEQQQLIDYIIGLWNIIDYDQAISYYGSYEAMIRAFHDNTGSEYDIKEDRDNYSDAVYADCTAVLLREGNILDVKEIPTLPQEKKMQLFYLLSQRTSARPKQIRKYLHLTKPPK